MATKTKPKQRKTKSPRPPRTYQAFVQRFPRLGEAWELIGQAGREGPLQERDARLIKLAVAMGAMREGAVHSNVRRAIAAGIDSDEIYQVVALAAGTLGMSSAAAVFTWVRDVTGK